MNANQPVRQVSGLGLDIVVGGDAGALREELESAIASSSLRVRHIEFCTTVEGLIEVARYRLPHYVFIASPALLERIWDLTHGILAVSPASCILGMFSPAHQELTPARLVEAYRAGVRDFLTRPLSSVELDRVCLKVRSGEAALASEKIGEIVTFVSNKGGVGKSTLAVHSALALVKRAPGRVLLLDAGLQLGVCADALDLQPMTSLLDAVRQADRLDTTLMSELCTMHSSGLLVLSAPPDATSATEVDAAALARVLACARRAFDYIIVDTFPLFDEVVLTIVDLAQRVYVVTQPTVPAVRGTRSYLELLGRAGLPAAQRRVILNHPHPPFPGELQPNVVQQALDAEIAHNISFNRRVLSTLNTGTPAQAARFLSFGWGRAIGALAREIAALGGEKPAVVGTRGAHQTERGHDPLERSAEEANVYERQ